jgi:ketosteroid isomerase-like protein
MSQSRQLASIMFTDIVGYTTLMGDSNKALHLKPQTTMKHTTKLLLTLAIIAISNQAFAQAQDVASVRAAIERHYAAINSQDISTAFEHHLPDFTWFSSDGRPLMEAGAAEAATRMGANLDFGTVNVYMSHFNAQIYDDIAVATFYLVGTHTFGDETKDGTWRVSAVWVREGDEWKEAHHHESPLMGEIHP